MSLEHLPEVIKRCEECGVQAGLAGLTLIGVVRWVLIDVIGLVAAVDAAKAKGQTKAKSNRGHYDHD